MNRGSFITVEGVEGAGKSTCIDQIADIIRDVGKHDVLLTREPGGTPLGESIRRILLDKNEHQMSPMTELLLLFAARSQHLDEVIIPALAAGKWVVCDRFTDSSYAYQGAGRELGQAPVAVLEKLVQKEFRPDLVFVLDLDVELGLTRATTHATADRFESEDMAFFERVRQGFTRQAVTDDRYRLIDASGSIEDVQKKIMDEMIQAFFS